MLYKLIKLPLFIVSTLCISVLTAAPLTPNELHATMGIVTNFILSDDNIKFHGKSYQPVTSPHTGRVWLDRNIGANKKCVSFEDAQCYGYPFQWGRAYDGHEVSGMYSTPMLATDINNAGTLFIRGATDWTTADSPYGNARATNWLNTDGSSVCPVGYRVPLKSELNAEVGNISNTGTAYTNFLKFPATGYKDYFDASDVVVGIGGGVWSATSTLNGASSFNFHTGTSYWINDGVRSYGFSVRCIKHVGKPLIYHNTTTYGTVTSPYTGKVWLDRNLGALQVCTAFNDAACYGDYYQWGRNFDGHEDNESSNYNVLANNVNNVGHNNFILSRENPKDWASIDASGSIRSANWAKTDGSSVCPIGFRVPSSVELQLETIRNGVTNSDTAFINFLKIPSAGVRTSSGMRQVGLIGYLWTNTANGFYANHIYFNLQRAFYRATGDTVRCVKD